MPPLYHFPLAACQWRPNDLQEHESHQKRSGARFWYRAPRGCDCTEVVPPDEFICRIDNEVAVAIGGQQVANGAYRITPDRVVRRIDHAVLVVIAGEVRDGRH